MQRIFLLTVVLGSSVLLSCARGTAQSITTPVDAIGGESRVVPKFSDNKTLVNSSITNDDDGNVGIGQWMSISGKGATTVSNNALNSGEVGIASEATDSVVSYVGFLGLTGPQMHFRLTRAYCDKRSNSTQSSSDQANFFCVPDAVTIDDTHPPSSTPNKNFMIAPYQSGMVMEYPGTLETWTQVFSVHANHQLCIEADSYWWDAGSCNAAAHLVVGDNNDLGGVSMTSYSALNNGALDRSQSFVLIASETFSQGSHGDMLFALRDSQDNFRFQFGSPRTGGANDPATFKQFTRARIDGTGKGFFDGGTQTGGADFAESVSASKAKDKYEPGDVLVIDTNSDRQVSLSTAPYSTLVAGIYSTKPGVIATLHNSENPKLKDEIPMAIVGIVPCKVSAENGPISRGDLLVTSSTPGYAMRATDITKLSGAIVGKALQPLSEGNGKIEVLITLR